MLTHPFRVSVLLGFIASLVAGGQAQVVINEISSASSDRALRIDSNGFPRLGCDVAWFERGFADSSWMTGPGPFGFGYPTQGTNLASAMQNKLATFYLRREFTVTAAQAASTDPLEFVADYDDGIVVFLNGIEVARRNAGPAPAFVFHDQTAYNRHPAGAAETIQLGPANARLTAGTNLLAIHVLNDAVTQASGYVGHSPASTMLRCDPMLRIGGATSATLVASADAWRCFPGAHEPSGGLLDPTDFSVTTAPGPNWAQLDFPDSGWPQAAGALGFDTAADYVPQFGTGTNFTQMRTVNMSVYMRREFQLTQAQLDGITSLTMTADFDDGYVLYLNGLEISRNSLPGAPGAFVSFNQPATGHNASRDGGANNPSLIIPVGVNKSQLRAGKNVIAAQLHNSDVGSSDLLLDVQFSAAGAAPLTFVTRNSPWRYLIPTSEIGVPPATPGIPPPQFLDWVELKNPGAAAVSLDGWALTDERDEPQKWVFPNGIQIPAGGYLVVACSGRDVVAPAAGGLLHTNFSLDADGEYVGLRNSGGAVISEVNGMPDQDFFHTWGVIPGGGSYAFLDRATPGAANAGTVSGGRVDDVTIDRETGFYDAIATVALACPTPGAEIRFTSNGTEPDQVSGTLYSAPFQISSQAELTTGNILRESWTGVPGANVSNFAYNTPPNSSTLHSPVEISTNTGDNIANRLRGHLRPAITDTYIFWIAGDDSAELWMSADESAAGKQRIAYTTSPTALRGFDLSPTQQSAPIALQAGGKYYIEVLHKDATGTDHVSVGWNRVGSPRNVMGGGAVSPAQNPGGTSLPATGVVLRARAFAPGLLPSDIETRNYALNFDSRIRSIPAVFLTGPGGQTFFAPNGIFTISGGNFNTGNWAPNNPTVDYNFCLMHGEAFERPSVFEVLNPGNQLAVRTTVGARFSASPWSRPQQRHQNLDTATWNSGWQNKPQINVHFRDDFGVARLRKEGFIPGSHLDEWDTLRLRAGKNDAYNPFIVDEMMRRFFRRMGQPSPIGFFSTLFINGRLKSHFNPTERPRDSFFQEFHDSPNEWDVNVIYEWESGDASAHNQMQAFFRQNDFSIDANYQTGATYWDVENVADYYLINAWGSTQDWPHNNFTFARERAPGAKWMFSMWDAEGAFGVFGQSTAHNTFNTDLLVPENGSRSPAIGSDTLTSRLVFRRFFQSPEFRMLFADRIQKHFFAPGGCLTATARQAEFVALRNTMNPVIQAILGQSLNEGFWNNWGGTARLNTLLSQARTLGMWPVTQPPNLTPFGGTVSTGTTVTLTNPNGAGTIYFTTDGTDPRAAGGAAQGTSYAAPIAVTQPFRLKARVLNGAEWSPLNEADFAPTPPAILITEINYNPPGSGDGTEFIELTNIGSTAGLNGAHFSEGISFVFGDVTLNAGDRLVLVKDQAAFAAAFPSVPVAGVFTGQLDNSGETLTLRDIAENILCSVTYGDSNIPGWPADPDGEGYSLVLKRPASNPPLNSPVHWRSSASTGGNPGGSDATTFVGPNPVGDMDGDGFSALVEYALGADDTDPANDSRPFHRPRQHRRADDFRPASRRRR